MATIANLRGRLRDYAKVQATEGIDDSQLDQILRDCLHRHDSSLGGNFAILPASHEEPLLILAWASISFVRASKVAPEPNLNMSRMTSVAFGQDRDSPFNKCFSMAKALEERYRQILKTIGFTPPGAETGGITVGVLRVKEDLTDLPTEIPFDQVIGPFLTIETDETSSDEVTFTWTKSTDFYFNEYIVFQSTNPGIRQSWNWSSGSGVPEISDAAEKLISITDANQTTVKVENLSALTTYYFLVVVKTTHGKFGYSNEVSVSVL